MELARATLVGKKAVAVLTKPSFAAQVIAVLSNAVYLLDRSGEVLWLVPPGSIRHRRCILSELPPGRLATGQLCTVDRGRLRIGDVLSIEFDRADRWESVPKEVCAVPLLRAKRAFWTAVAELRRDCHPQGLALALERALSDPARSSVEALLMKKAEHVIEQFAEACCTHNLAHVLFLGTHLVGLGSGLTPSGDDLLGAFLFTLRFLDGTYPCRFGFDWDLVHEWLIGVSPLTNQISHALLSDLALGHGPGPLYDLLVASFEARGPATIVHRAKELVRIGHTSGWDMLAGVYTGMRMVEDASPVSLQADPQAWMSS